MRKVCLVNIGDSREYGQIDEGLGLASSGLEWIAGVLKKNGCDVNILDQSFNGLNDYEVVKRIQTMAPDIVGFNPLCSHRTRVQDIALQVKKVCENIITVIGGYDATFLPLERYAGIDYIVRGRGELAMLELVNVISDETRTRLVGVATRILSGTEEHLEERAISLPLDQLPIPYRSDDYLREIVERNEPVSLVASVGCDWDCAFCSTPQMYPSGRQERPLNDVLREIDELVSKGVKKFSFWDEDFFGKRKPNIARADEIVQYIKNVKYPDGSVGGVITFSFMTSPGMVLAERMGLLPKWEGTVNRIYIGIEGGCREALLNLGNKSCLNPDTNAKAVSIIRQYQIGLQYGFIMFNPYSGFEELENSAKFLLDNELAATGISFLHRTRPYPGTEMYSQLHNEGLLIDQVATGEVDVFKGLPYYFKSDLEKGTNIREFALAMARVNSDRRLNEVEQLVNEIDTRFAAEGILREVFESWETCHKPMIPDDRALIRNYRELRKDVGKLNYDFFMQCLEVFRDNEGKGIDEIIGSYFGELDLMIAALNEIKCRIPDVAESAKNVPEQSRCVLYAAKGKDRADFRGVCFGAERM